MENKSIFLSVGDPSGDIASSKIVEELKKINPDLRITGLGGERLKAQGQFQYASGKDLAVLGFWEVAKRYGYFRNLFKKCLAEIKKEKPSAVVLVDYPGFNLRLAKKVKKLGIPVIYYISPQIWAWGKRRISDIKRDVDRMLVILPFEEQYYKERGVNAKFVGHYLLEDIPREYISSKTPKIENGKETIALLPGSRYQEVERMLKPMLRAVRQFNKKYGTKAVVAGVKGLYDYENVLREFKDNNISIEYNNSREVIYKSSIVITASGTATLETGIIGRPMVVIYKTGTLTYNIAKRLVKLDKIALANLVLNEKEIPELIQNKASSKHIYDELEKFWVDSNYYNRVQLHLFSIPSLLGGVGASERVSGIISEYL